MIYKPVQLPVDLIEDLKMYKDAYGMLLAEEEDEWGNPIPVHVSYEQMFRRWMDNVKKFGKDVQKEVDEYRRIRAERPAPVYHPVDPCEGDIWEMEYFVPGETVTSTRLSLIRSLLSTPSLTVRRRAQSSLSMRNTNCRMMLPLSST